MSHAVFCPNVAYSDSNSSGELALVVVLAKLLLFVRSN